MGRGTTVYSEEFRQKFIAEYRKCNCLMYKACRNIGVSHRAVQNWAKLHEELAADIELAREELADDVEGALVKDALSEDGAPVSKIFFLKNNRKERYGDRQVVELETKQLWFEPIQAPTQDFIEGEVVEEKKLGTS